MDAATPPTQSIPPLTVEEVLEVLLHCFEAAADTYPPFLLAYAQPRRSMTQGLDSYLVWHVLDLDDPPIDPSSIPFPPAALPGALAKMNMCDAFAWLLEEEANKKLQEHFGASARWMRVAPQPTFLLSCRADPRQNEIPAHSVLVVTDRGGGRMIMDGTPEQFGWPRSTWLLSANEFFEFRVERQVQHNAVWASDQDRQKATEAMRINDGGFWAVVQERMEQLFDELKWDDLGALPREERVEVLKKQAGTKFAGAWEETWERWNGR